MTCLSAIDPAASKSVAQLQELAGVPGNKPVRHKLETAACLLLDRAEDLVEARERIESLTLLMEQFMRTATENANVVLTKLKDTQTALDTATAALAGATKLAKTQDETDALKLVADAAGTIAPEVA